MEGGNLPIVGLLKNLIFVRGASDIGWRRSSRSQFGMCGRDERTWAFSTVRDARPVPRDGKKSGGQPLGIARRVPRLRKAVARRGPDRRRCVAGRTIRRVVRRRRRSGERSSPVAVSRRPPTRRRRTRCGVRPRRKGPASMTHGACTLYPRGRSHEMSARKSRARSRPFIDAGDPPRSTSGKVSALNDT